MIPDPKTTASYLFGIDARVVQMAVSLLFIIAVACSVAEIFRTLSLSCIDLAVTVMRNAFRRATA